MSVARKNRRTARRTNEPVAVERVGFSVRNWCAAVSISRSNMYSLPPHKKPHSMMVGKRRRVIVETPAAWLARVGEPAGE